MAPLQRRRTKHGYYKNRRFGQGAMDELLWCGIAFAMTKTNDGGFALAGQRLVKEIVRVINNGQ